MGEGWSLGALSLSRARFTRTHTHTLPHPHPHTSRLGWKVVRKEMTATKFYFSRLFEAVPM
jgi:hypothetical protein